MWEGGGPGEQTAVSGKVNLSGSGLPETMKMFLIPVFRNSAPFFIMLLLGGLTS